MSSKAQVFSLTQNHFHGSRKEIIFILLSKSENNICCASPGTHKKRLQSQQRILPFCDGEQYSLYFNCACATNSSQFSRQRTRDGTNCTHCTA